MRLRSDERKVKFREWANWTPVQSGWKLDEYELQRLMQEESIGWSAVRAFYPSTIDGMHVAVKVCDWLRNEDGDKEMGDEARIYEVLRPL